MKKTRDRSKDFSILLNILFSLIVCTYPCQVAERGCALDINWSRKRFKPELTYSPSTSETLKEEQKSSEDGLNELCNRTDKKELVDEGTLYEINLNHVR